MAGAIINSSTRIKNHCIINTSSTIDHDCVMSNFSSIAPNAAIGVLMAKNILAHC